MTNGCWEWLIMATRGIAVDTQVNENWQWFMINDGWWFASTFAFVGNPCQSLINDGEWISNYRVYQLNDYLGGWCFRTCFMFHCYWGWDTMIYPIDRHGWNHQTVSRWTLSFPRPADARSNTPGQVPLSHSMNRSLISNSAWLIGLKALQNYSIFFLPAMIVREFGCRWLRDDSKGLFRDGSGYMVRHRTWSWLIVEGGQ